MSLAPAELKCQVIHQHVGSSPPHQPALVMRLSELCHDLKLGGAALEEAGTELDTLQARLLQVCQQSGPDLKLRLQILELAYEKRYKENRLKLYLFSLEKHISKKVK